MWVGGWVGAGPRSGGWVPTCWLGIATARHLPAAVASNGKHNQCASPACACHSEWRVGNEFYRQIQRTGGGLVSLCCPCWSSCCCCHGVRGRGSSWVSVWVSASWPPCMGTLASLHMPQFGMRPCAARASPRTLHASSSTPLLSRHRHLRATASCAGAFADPPLHVWYTFPAAAGAGGVL